jgi:DNA-binding ferritin-like protein
MCKKTKEGYLKKIKYNNISGLSKLMSQTTDTGLSNRAYDILRTLGKEADFLYNTINKYVQDAENDGRQDLVDMWKTIKQDREKHTRMLKDALEREFHQ